MMKTRITIVAATLLFAGCASAPPPRIITRTVNVEHDVYVSLDKKLMPEIFPAAKLSGNITNGKIFEAWQFDAAQLGICKPALDAIRSLQPASAGSVDVPAGQ